MYRLSIYFLWKSATFYYIECISSGNLVVLEIVEFDIFFLRADFLNN